MLITVANFRQFTSPYVLDSLKPQLKLVQSSVGDQEVMDSLAMCFRMYFKWTLYDTYILIIKPHLTTYHVCKTHEYSMKKWKFLNMTSLGPGVLGRGHD